jgi:hypothetical protein
MESERYRPTIRIRLDLPLMQLVAGRTGQDFNRRKARGTTILSDVESPLHSDVHRVRASERAPVPAQA